MIKQIVDKNWRDNFLVKVVILCTLHYLEDKPNELNKSNQTFRLRLELVYFICFYLSLHNLVV